jgi:AcrR family transcriptional regulator
VSRRSYRLGQREAASARTRARILAAARALLAGPAGILGFSVDAVAEQAGVARMTVYYQFGSKRGLLEALLDDLARRALIGAPGGGEGLPAAFQRPDALDALDAFIAAFGRFWAADRLVLRRLRALAVLDPDFEGVRARDEWRREGVQVLLGRLAEQYGRPTAESRAEAADVLHTLTSFETFDTLAGPSRSPEEMVPLVQRLARAALGLAAR